MPRLSNAREQILATARQLFAEKGVQKTSLQEIASQLGITKPALYYHFSSREELVRSIVQPLIDDGERFLVEQEARTDVDPRALLEGFFDFNFRYRADILLVLTEMTTLAELGLIDIVLSWRERAARLMFGGRPTLEQSVRAVLALGGIQDCTMQFPHVPVDELRAVTLAAAYDALGV